MDTGHLKGNGGIEHGSENPGRLEQHKAREQVPGRVDDSAAISDGGREILAAVESMTRKLKDGHLDRRPHVEAAQALLQSGELDQPDVYLETSRRMLRSGF